MGIGNAVGGGSGEGRPRARRVAYRLAPWIALLWFLVAAQVSGIQVLNWQLREPLSAFGEDRISVLLQRYTAIQADLGGASRVGYITDVTELRQTRLVSYLDRHVMGRALVPTLVVPSGDEDLVVGSFDDPKRGLAEARRRGLKIVRDYGDGLYLFGRSR